MRASLGFSELASWARDDCVIISSDRSDNGQDVSSRSVPVEMTSPIEPEEAKKSSKKRKRKDRGPADTSNSPEPVPKQVICTDPIGVAMTEVNVHLNKLDELRSKSGMAGSIRGEMRDRVKHYYGLKLIPSIGCYLV